MPMNNAANYLFGPGCILVSAGLCTSPAMVSIGMGALGASVIVNTSKIKSGLGYFIRPLYAGWILYFVLTLASYFQHKDSGLWWDECRVKLPMLVVPLAFALNEKHIAKWKIPAILIFTTTITGVNISTLVHYINHFRECNELILASKPVPIQTTTRSISHIYFGVMTAFSGGMGLLLWNKYKGTMGKIMGVCGVICIICLHLFASRTGLMVLYGTGLVLILYNIRQKIISIKWLGLIPIGFVLLCLIILLTPSLKNRYTNTLEDIDQYKNSKDITHSSLSKRILVWNFASEIWLENPVLGIGPGNVKKEILERYDGSKYYVADSERVADPHNQFLEAAAGLGIPGITSLILIFLPCLNRTTTPEFILIAAAVFFATIGESFFERQTGISFSILFWLLLHDEKD
jgi:O-antigen ligase